jgi:6-phosphogluconate dehydrogenase (decarboxylating)
MTTPTNTLDKGKVQLGIIGLGLMGSRLTQRLHSAGWTFLSSLNERTVSCQFTTCWITGHDINIPVVATLQAGTPNNTLVKQNHG